MTDLLITLPHFDTRPFSNLLPSLEKHHITLTDILSSDASDIAKRAQLPVRQVQALADAVLHTLHAQLDLVDEQKEQETGPCLRTFDLLSQWHVISLLDDGLDAALGGGIPAGYLSEVTGESGVGKTQFLLTLLLAVQLPPPLGLSRSALYISTEAPLPTARLSQLLQTHPVLAALPPNEKPSLSKVLALQTPDLESQDHILRYQLPVAIRRNNVGLVVIDSITANFRAEFDNPSSKHGYCGTTPATRIGSASMARRSAQLVETGALLRDLCRSENIAVVVSNQVADRFQSETSLADIAGGEASTQPDVANLRSKGSRVEQSHPPLMPPASEPPRSTTPTNAPHGTHNPLTLDHQQRWFTGWGASQSRKATSFVHSNTNLKTPSLGLVWTNQIACRIAIIKNPLLGRAVEGDEARQWRRHMKVVFAPWAEGETGEGGKEFTIERNGIRAVVKKNDNKRARTDEELQI